jgi:hypothetical protein
VLGRADDGGDVPRAAPVVALAGVAPVPAPRAEGRGSGLGGRLAGGRVGLGIVTEVSGMRAATTRRTPFPRVPVLLP